MKVFLIDDHRMMNSALASLLKETGRFKECDQANTLGEARAYIEANRDKLPDLVILDIMLGEENGLDFLPFLSDFCKTNHLNKPPLLVCSALEEASRIQTALKLNAQGYVSKSCGETELLAAIDTVLRGGLYVSGGDIGKLLKSQEIYDKFTKRELEIFNLIKKNKSNKEIAEELGLNIRTVESHIGNIYFKTGAKTRQELLTM